MSDEAGGCQHGGWMGRWDFKADEGLGGGLSRRMRDEAGAEREAVKADRMRRGAVKADKAG